MLRVHFILLGRYGNQGSNGIIHTREILSFALGICFQKHRTPNDLISDKRMLDAIPFLLSSGKFLTGKLFGKSFIIMPRGILFLGNQGLAGLDRGKTFLLGKDGNGRTGTERQEWDGEAGVGWNGRRDTAGLDRKEWYGWIGTAGLDRKEWYGQDDSGKDRLGWNG